MEVTGPFTLTLGQELDVTPPNGSSRFTRVVLANASPFGCQVNSGGVAQWLNPWSADVYPADGGNPALVTPVFTTASAAANDQIVATWYLDTDPLAGTYPAALPVQGVTAQVNGAVDITSGSVTINNAAGSTAVQTYPRSVNGTKFVVPYNANTTLVTPTAGKSLVIGLCSVWNNTNVVVETDLKDGAATFLDVAIPAGTTQVFDADYLCQPNNALSVGVGVGPSSGNVVVCVSTIAT